MLCTTEKMFEEARSGHFAVPAPDFWNSNSCRVFTRTAEELKKPLCLSFAEVHLSMMDVEEAAMIGCFYAKRAGVPVALHLDHGVSMPLIEDAIRYGFTSVMIDASADSFEENVRKTREVVKMAHAAGVVVEGEIGHVGVNEGDSARSAEGSVYTEVDDAVCFVKETGVDSLAVSIGTSHGLYKGEPVLSFTRLMELRKALPVPLVLHGGSGTGDENLCRCAREGISKINLYTDFIVAAYRSVKVNEPENWPALLKTSEDSIQNVLRHYYRVFG